MLAQEPMDQAETGRRLGFDLYAYTYYPPGAAWPEALHEGFALARQRGTRRGMADRFTRKWLQLRLNAYRRDRHVDTAVTPDFLRKIDIACCPVTRTRLTFGEHLPSDWSIDRLNNDGAYAPRNLAVISTRANLAKGDRSYAAVYALSQRPIATDGLTPGEWLRLAVLMLGPCHTELPYLAPALPLVAELPSYTARPAIQIVQYALTLLSASSDGRRLLGRQFKAHSHAHTHAWLDILLRELSEARRSVDVGWDAWHTRRVMHAFIAWRNGFDLPAFAAIGEVASQLIQSQKIAYDELQSWRLSSRGYATA